jgi:hypothetical protein
LSRHVKSVPHVQYEGRDGVILPHGGEGHDEGYDSDKGYNSDGNISDGVEEDDEEQFTVDNEDEAEDVW